MNKIKIGLLVSTLLASAVCFANPLTLSSPAIKPNGSIPAQCTCDGSDDSPALSWTNAIPNAKSYALVVENIDTSWVHWVVFNIPIESKGFSQAIHLAEGTLKGRNSWGSLNYQGPCSKSGPYSYRFRLYALDTTLAFDSAPNKTDLEKAMQTHILDTAEFVGKYGSPLR